MFDYLIIFLESILLIYIFLCLKLLYQLLQQNNKLLEADYWKKNITLQINISSTLIVFGDKNMMQVITRNLLSNAIKFSNIDGIIIIDFEILGDMVEIQITDSGIGISEENCSKLFQIGNSYKNTGTLGEEGSGLGLLLCKEFVEKHGGKIKIKSILGKGSTFSYTLPYCNGNSINEVIN